MRSGSNMPRPEDRHMPVMLREVIDALTPRRGGTYVDGTFGAGGYTRGILEAADCIVVAIDRDPDAITEGQDLTGRYPGRLRLRHGKFGEMDTVVAREGCGAVDGVDRKSTRLNSSH